MRSSTVIGLMAGSLLLSSRGPAGSLSTERSANSGSHLEMGSERASLPSSSSCRASTVVRGLVMEAMRNSVSFCIALPPSMSLIPTA